MNKKIIFSEENYAVTKQTVKMTKMTHFLSFISGGCIKNQKQVGVLALIIIVAFISYLLWLHYQTKQADLTTLDIYKEHVKDHHPH